MSEITRRTLLRQAAAAGAAASLGSAPMALAKGTRRKSTGRSVAVLGGGMAGLTAAHELAERAALVDVDVEPALDQLVRGRQARHAAAEHRDALAV